MQIDDFPGGVCSGLDCVVKMTEPLNARRPGLNWELRISGEPT